MPTVITTSHLNGVDSLAHPGWSMHAGGGKTATESVVYLVKFDIIDFENARIEEVPGYLGKHYVGRAPNTRMVGRFEPSFNADEDGNPTNYMGTCTPHISLDGSVVFVSMGVGSNTSVVRVIVE